MRRDRRFDLAADAGLGVFARWIEREAERVEKRIAHVPTSVGARLAKRATVLRDVVALLKGVT